MSRTGEPLVQKNACDVVLLYTSPLACPAALMPTAALEPNPDRIPTSCRVPLVHTEPCSTPVLVDEPATCPEALMPFPSLAVNIGSTPRSVTLYCGCAATRDANPQRTTVRLKRPTRL